MIVVNDLDDAADRFERLGFNTTQVSHHESLGTSNRLIVFPHTYIELISIREPTPANQFLRNSLAIGEGLWRVALHTNDIEKTSRQLASGFEHETVIEVHRFGRDIEIDGNNVRARFAICPVPGNPVDAPSLFYCQHFTPQYIWNGSMLAGRNQHCRLGCFTKVVNNIDNAYKEIAPWIDRSNVPRTQDQIVVTTPGGVMRLVTSNLYEQYVGTKPVKRAREDFRCDHIRIVTNDQRHLEYIRKLHGNSIIKSTEKRIVTHRQLTCGVSLELCTQNNNHMWNKNA